MKPNLSARNELQDEAATKIQREWRKRQEDSRKKELTDGTKNTFKMSEEVRFMWS
jgi:hypothetical protein